MEEGILEEGEYPLHRHLGGLVAPGGHQQGGGAGEGAGEAPQLPPLGEEERGGARPGGGVEEELEPGGGIEEYEEKRWRSWRRMNQVSPGGGELGQPWAEDRGQGGRGLAQDTQLGGAA